MILGFRNVTMKIEQNLKFSNLLNEIEHMQIDFGCSC